MKMLRMLPVLPVLCLAGCSSFQPEAPATPVKAAATLTGSVHGGQQPVSGSTIQLYAVGKTGDGSAPSALLTLPVVTDLNGTFLITGLYTCPTPTTLVYITASGGNPGLTAGTNNSALTMEAALGSCGALSSSTFISIDEVTTVAAAAALAPFTTPPFNVGSSTSDLPALQQAFATAISFANTSSGTSPGIGQSTSSTTNVSIPAAEINTLANVLASCVNTASAASNACASLFNLTGSPTNVMSAAVNLEINPSAYNTAAIFALAPSTGPFQPQLPAAPSTFAIVPTTPAGGSCTSAALNGLTTTPCNVTVGSTVVIANTGANCAFVPPFSVTFGGVQASGSFTSNQITAVVPYGTPLGPVNGLVTLSGSMPKNCSFTVNNFDASSLSGISITPASLTFGSQMVATQSAAMTVTVNNGNTSAVQVSNAAVTGGAASSFAVTATTCSAALLQPASTCTISVAFRPLALGSLTSTLQVYINGIAFTTPTVLSGTGS